jgi:hypothetical protein
MLEKQAQKAARAAARAEEKRAKRLLEAVANKKDSGVRLLDIPLGEVSAKVPVFETIQDCQVATGLSAANLLSST